MLPLWSVILSRDIRTLLIQKKKAVSLAGFLSLTAVVTMFCFILVCFRNVIRSWKLPRAERPQLIQVPMELFMLSLFLADLFQSLGVVMDVRWISNGIVHMGGYCTIQGRVFQNIGQAAIAMSTFIITVHTFDCIWRHGGVKSLKLASIIIGTVWTFLVLTVSIAASVKRHPSFYAPTPYWCWINSSYTNYRIALENFWLWIGFAVSILYVPLLFWDTGRITPGDPNWWTFTVNSGDARRGQRRFKLIMYAHRFCALAYCLPVLPTSLARWFLLVHGDVKPFATAEAQFIAKAIFSLSGVFDVIAFKFARSGLLLFSSPQDVAERPSSPEKESRDSLNNVGSEISTPSILLDNAGSVPNSGSTRKLWRSICENYSTRNMYILTFNHKAWE
ncbi:hypothetical protein C8R44DRAFT_948737 [Mycena epipterygia]|nr:hypothetical protein C8R44DRAFT_948737 [Mycena epipterygia]